MSKRRSNMAAHYKVRGAMKGLQNPSGVQSSSGPIVKRTRIKMRKAKSKSKQKLRPRKPFTECPHCGCFISRVPLQVHLMRCPKYKPAVEKAAVPLEVGVAAGPLPTAGWTFRQAESIRKLRGLRPGKSAGMTAVHSLNNGTATPPRNTRLRPAEQTVDKLPALAKKRGQANSGSATPPLDDRLRPPEQTIDKLSAFAKKGGETNIGTATPPLNDRLLPAEQAIDKLPALAKRRGELIHLLPRCQVNLNAALAKISEACNNAAIVAARRACQDIQVIIGLLIKLDSAAIGKQQKKSNRKVQTARASGSNRKRSIWLVAQGESRKPGSYRA